MRRYGKKNLVRFLGLLVTITIIAVAYFFIFTHNKTSPYRPSYSGQSVPIGNKPGWRQIYYDNFAGENAFLGSFSNCSWSNLICKGLPTDLQSKWWDYPDGTLDTKKNCQYWPSKTLSISGGLMNIFIHTQNHLCMTAVPEPKLPNPIDRHNGQLYGMYSVRFRADALPDYKTAFLLWPDSNKWPQDGEIDFPEGSLTSYMAANMHYQGATSGKQLDHYSTNVSYTNWSTATIEWTPTYVKFILNGNTIGISTSKIPNTPMHWVLQTESDNAIKPSSSAAGNLQIAWVAIWAYDPNIK